MISNSGNVAVSRFDAARAFCQFSSASLSRSKGQVRVPLYIAIPLLIIVPLTVWFVGTAKYDFMTPEQIPDDQLRPEFAAPVDHELAASITEAALPEPEPEPVPPPVPDLDPGAIMTSPAIDEYRDQADAGAAALAKLGNKLLEMGQPLRATLAFERILDSTPEGGSERISASQMLPALRRQLPPWNFDPLLVAPLTMNISTARPKEELRPALEMLADIVKLHSGNTVRLETRFPNKSTAKSTLPAAPIAMWLTVPGEDPATPSLAVRTLTPGPDEDLVNSLGRCLYELLAMRSKNIGELTPLPDFPEESSPHKVFGENFTLLLWHRILTTPFQAIDPPDTNPPENTGELSSPTTELKEDEQTASPDKFSQDNPSDWR